MSHRATNWAFEQRGLKPAAKLVLLCLADRHNPDYGCFPAQDTLAADTEMSRSALNENLKTLEAAGLIRREQRKTGKSKRQASTRYLLGFEIEPDPQDIVEPCPESGHGNGADSVSGNGEKPCPDSGESRVRNPDTNPVREPVSKPVNEREGAQARAEDGEQNSDPDQDVDGRQNDDPAKFAKRVKRLEMGDAGNPWPGALASSTQWAIRQFADLTDAQRALAEKRRNAYLAECRRIKARPVAIGVYFRDRKFEDVADEAEAAPQILGVAPFGPVWAALRFKALLAGPEVTEFRLTGFERMAVEAGDLDHGTLMAQKRCAQGWPSVNELDTAAAQGRSKSIKAGDAPPDDLCEPVPVDSDTFAAWRDEHARRGWPMMPDPGRMRVVYFPKGGPDGLDAFGRAVAGGAISNEGKAA